VSPFRQTDPPLLEILAFAALGAVIWDIFFGIPIAVLVGLLVLSVGAKIAWNWRERFKRR
jgi:hypothetical protein